MSQTIAGTQRAQDLSVPDTLEATSKYFVIPHPAEPGKQLVHAAIESNQHLVMYHGILDFEPFDKRKVIPLPQYFSALVNEDDVTIHLTPLNNYDQFTYCYDYVHGEWIVRRRGFIRPVSVSYLVIAERKDIPKLEETR